MSLPKAIKDKYLARFDELIADGNRLLNTRYSSSDPYLGSSNWVDFSQCSIWKPKCIALLENVLPPKSNLRSYIQKIEKVGNSLDYVAEIAHGLVAIREDFEKGFFDTLSSQIEGNIAADYLGQAEKLIEEGADGKYDHVPAAVLAGAVLEKTLRSLCEAQTPPLSTTKENGDPFAMGRLIDDLKKAGAFNEAKAKELKGFADIRNHAAHGRFSEFDKGQVNRMIEGVNSFIANC